MPVVLLLVFNAFFPPNCETFPSRSRSLSSSKWFLVLWFLYIHPYSNFNGTLAPDCWKYLSLHLNRQTVGFPCNIIFTVLNLVFKSGFQKCNCNRLSEVHSWQDVELSGVTKCLLPMRSHYYGQCNSTARCWSMTFQSISRQKIECNLHFKKFCEVENQCGLTTPLRKAF
jgi:hypothetical protein